MATKSNGKSEKPQNPWKAFLSPLKGRLKGPHETINWEEILQSLCLSQDLADLLKQQEQIMEKKTQRDEQEGPRLIPVNKWTIRMVTKYVSFEKYVSELDLPTQHVPDDSTTESDTDKLYNDVLDMFGAESLEKIMNRESEIRLFIDGIVQRLCKRHSLRIMMEKLITSNSLPNGRFDYLILTKEWKPIGCIEARSTVRFNKKAFGQAVMKIILLQRQAKRNGVNVEKTPVFCILSDAYQYVLIMLKGSELLLEVDKETSVKEPEVSNIRKLDSSENNENLVSAMSNIKLQQDDEAAAGKELAKVINIRKLDSLENYKDLVSAMSCMISMSTNDLCSVKTEAKEEP